MMKKASLRRPLEQEKAALDENFRRSGAIESVDLLNRLSREFNCSLTRKELFSFISGLRNS